LVGRFIEEEPLTLDQKEFVMRSMDKYWQGEPPQKRKTKEEIEKAKIDGDKEVAKQI
jgi:hypothetical protein